MEETILTVEQVAQILQVHPFTVLKFIKQGKLKAARLGRVYRIRRSDVDKFLDAQAGGAAPASEPKPKKSSRSAAPPAKKASASKDVSRDSSLTDESKEVALKEELKGQKEKKAAEIDRNTEENTEEDHYVIDFTI